MEFFEIFSVLFMIVWFSIFIFIIYTFIKNIKRNKNAPLLHVDAEVVDKEKSVRRTNHGNNHSMHHTHTAYYISFKVRSGDIIKLAVTNDVYNFLFVGDKGVLEFKGTQFLGFGKDDQ